MKDLIPSWTEIGREAIIVMAGALLAALILSRLPAVRDFVQRNTTGSGGCGCQDHT